MHLKKIILLKNHGFSFIEVLIAMFIFSFVSLSILRIYLASVSGETKNTLYYFAVKLADEKMKYISRQKNSNCTVKMSNEYIEYKLSDSIKIYYNRIVSIKKINNDLLFIKVSVIWKTRDGKDEQYEIETYI